MADNLTTEQQLKVARLWADLDGCEGGDLLAVLCDAVEMTHYSYADNEVLEKGLLDLLNKEVAAHEAMATGPNHDDYGYFEPQLTETLRAIIEVTKRTGTEKRKNYGRQ